MTWRWVSSTSRVRWSKTDRRHRLDPRTARSIPRPAAPGIAFPVMDVKGTMTFTIAETRFTDAETGELVATARNNFINRQ